MKPPPKLKIRAPFCEWHSVSWMIYEGRYKLRNIRYALDAHWDLNCSHITCARVYCVGDSCKDCGSAFSIFQKFSRYEEFFRGENSGSAASPKPLIFSAFTMKVHSHEDLKKIVMECVNADWEKRCSLKSGEILYDQLYLCQSPGEYKIYDEKNLWANFFFFPN